MTKKILVVDDEPDILKIVTFRLEKTGYEVKTASNGREAFDLMQKEKPDLLLLDLRLPVMSGYEVCKQMKSDENLKDVPIILLTASSSASIEQKTKEFKADDYMIKPFDPEQLLAKVKNMIG